MSREERKRDKDKEHFLFKVFICIIPVESRHCQVQKGERQKENALFFNFLMKAKHKILSQPFFFPTSAETANLHQ